MKIAAIIILVGLAAGVFLLVRHSGGSNRSSSASEPENNVSMADGKQVVEIIAKGGYQPRKSVAKAGVPTVLRFKSAGTFDCSSFVVIPALKLQKSLGNSGTTEIDIGSREPGTLSGSCAMGMYRFEILFE